MRTYLNHSLDPVARVAARVLRIAVAGQRVVHRNLLRRLLANRGIGHV